MKRERNVSEHGGDIKRVMERYELRFEEIIDFSANINPLSPPDYVQDIILKHIKSINHYPDTRAKDLQLAISEYLNVQRENIIPANGSVELIYLLAQMIPTQALILAPTFSEYARAYNKRYNLLNIRQDDFQVPIDDLIDAIKENSTYSRIVFICNPNNPTGDIIKKQDILKIVKEAKKEDVLVVIDEAFMDFLPQEETVTQEIDRHKNLFVIRSLTKFFGLPGLRIGYGVANKDLIKKLSNFQPPWSVNSLAQAVGTIVIKDKDFIRKSKEFMKKEQGYLFERLTTIKGLKPYPSKTNFILIKLLTQTSDWLCDELGKKGLILRNCSNFELLDNRFIRVAVQKRMENLRLIQTIGEVLCKR